MTTDKPRICFGMTLYNNASYLPEALESILGQSYGDFKLVVIDDSSTDGTAELMQRYMAQDQRVSYHRQLTWSGMIATWRTAFQKAYEMYQPDYFAWVSDHDHWHQNWLKQHLHVLNEHTDIVLAYPQTIPISAEGEHLPLEHIPSFETWGLSRAERLYSVSAKQIGAGNAIYGLFRVEPLIKAGIFRSVMLPDRLLLMEISAYGAIKQIAEPLWDRRFFGSPKNKAELFLDQKRKLFGATVPLHAYCPFTSHSLSLLLSLSIRPGVGDFSNFWTGLLLAAANWEVRYERYIKQELAILQEVFATQPDVTSPPQLYQDLADKALPDIPLTLRKVTASLLESYVSDTNNLPNISEISFMNLFFNQNANTGILNEKAKWARLQNEYQSIEANLSLVSRIKRRLQSIKGLSPFYR